jgi:hypothetical protein
MISVRMNCGSQEEGKDKWERKKLHNLTLIAILISIIMAGNEKSELLINNLGYAFLLFTILLLLPPFFRLKS